MSGEFNKAAQEVLVDPDSDVAKTSNFSWGEDYQREILGMLISDRQFLMSTRGLIKPYYFTNKAHREICRSLFSYWDKYKSQPTKTIIANEISERFKDNDSKLFYLGSLTTLYDYYQPGLDSREYNLNKVVNFAKLQAIKDAWNKSYQSINTLGPTDETFEKIQSYWKDAMSISIDSDIGMDYYKEIAGRYSRGKEKISSENLFTTGFKSLDNGLTKGGFTRGELLSVMGIPGTGKSLSLVKTSVSNLFQRKKVLYVSCEMKEDEIAVRFDAQLANHNIRTLFNNGDFVVPAIMRQLQDYDPSEQTRLVIKWFPSGTLDVNLLRGYYEECKMKGFIADLLVVDYIGEMKDYRGMPLHESRELIVKDLVGFLGAENMAGATAMQPNRAAREAQQEGVLDDCHLGDAYGQTRPLHVFYSINQRDDEKQQGVGRGFNIKSRDGKSRFTFYLQWDQETLSIDEISQERYRAKLNDYKEKVISEVNIDNAGPSDPGFFGRKKKKRLTVENDPE